MSTLNTLLSACRTEQTPLLVATRERVALEPEAMALASSDGADAALGWLQTRPGITTAHLFAELSERVGEVTLTDWEPGLLFDVRARHLKLLRLKASRSEADKARFTPVMDQLLAGLIDADPARAAVLCG